MKCRPRREGDEYFCSECARRWGIDEPSPCEEDQSSDTGPPITPKSPASVSDTPEEPSSDC